MTKKKALFAQPVSINTPRTEITAKHTVKI